MKLLETIAVLIPAYNPDQGLVALVDSLLAEDFGMIIVINDGSAASCADTFARLESRPGVQLLAHSSNLGKGAALKTGFKFVLEHQPSIRGVVTGDADGQHLPTDIAKVAAAGAGSPLNVILGSRAFDEKIPARSLFGNRMTAVLMSFVHNLKLRDTQTGLRYLPRDLLPDLVTLSGNAYEFELQCLVQINALGYGIVEVPITTIYIENNASSHFSPIKDSIKIYNVLLRFSVSSIFCFLVDVVLFAITFSLFGSAMLATAVARIVSGVANFTINKFLVFSRGGSGHAGRETLGYFALWLALMLVSGTIVSTIEQNPAPFVVAAKILVDLSLFLVSYFVQSHFVFAQRDKA
jgi:glycosyltransferase involved in cell wall biosynthesis